MSKKNFRKTAAIGLAFIGLAGVGVASAAQLTLDAGDQDLVQAGTEDLTASLCQGSTIEVSFTLSGSTPGQLGEAPGAFGYPETEDAILLDEIDADCAGKQLKVALGDSNDVSLGEYGPVTAAAGTLTLSLATAFDDGAVDPADIDQISVTLFD